MPAKVYHETVKLNTRWIREDVASILAAYEEGSTELLAIRMQGRIGTILDTLDRIDNLEAV